MPSVARMMRRDRQLCHKMCFKMMVLVGKPNATSASMKFFCLRNMIFPLMSEATAGTLVRPTMSMM